MIIKSETDANPNSVIFGTGYVGKLLYDNLNLSYITSMVNPNIPTNLNTMVGIVASGPSSVNVTDAERLAWWESAEKWLMRFRESFSHLIYISSSHLYGGCEPDSAGCVESDNLNLKTPYGLYHANFENKLCSLFSERLTICRLSNVYGPQNLNRRQPGFISVAIRSAILGLPIPIYGDPRVKRDYLNESDLVRAIGLVMNKRTSGIFNVSSGSSFSQLEVISELEIFLDKKLAVIVHEPRVKDIGTSIIDSSNFRITFDWSPKINFRVGLQRVCANLHASNFCSAEK